MMGAVETGRCCTFILVLSALPRLLQFLLPHELGRAGEQKSCPESLLLHGGSYSTVKFYGYTARELASDHSCYWWHDDDDGEESVFSECCVGRRAVEAASYTCLFQRRRTSQPGRPRKQAERRRPTRRTDEAESDVRCGGCDRV